PQNLTSTPTRRSSDLRVVILLSVDAAELRRQMINIIVVLREHPFELPVGRDVGAEVSPVRLMLQVHAPNLVASPLELAHQRPSQDRKSTRLNSSHVAI